MLNRRKEASEIIFLLLSAFWLGTALKPTTTLKHFKCQTDYIYPFIKTDLLKATIDHVKHLEKRTDFGSLSYPAAGNINPAGLAGSAAG